MIALICFLFAELNLEDINFRYHTSEEACRSGNEGWFEWRLRRWPIFIIYLMRHRKGILVVFKHLGERRSFPSGSDCKESTCSGKGSPGGHDNPLEYSCLENPWTEEPGALQSTVAQRIRQDWVIEHTCGKKKCIYSSVQSLSHVQIFATPWTTSCRPPCPSPTPGVHSNPCPLRHWCHPTILSSVVPFSCPQSFPGSQSFQMSQLFTSGGQSIGVSASASVLPMNTQDWSPLGWTGWISLQSKGLTIVFSNTTVQKHQFFSAQLLHSPTLTSIHDD